MNVKLLCGVTQSENINFLMCSYEDFHFGPMRLHCDRAGNRKQVSSKCPDSLLAVCIVYVVFNQTYFFSADFFLLHCLFTLNKNDTQPSNNCLFVLHLTSGLYIIISKILVLHVYNELFQHPNQPRLVIWVKPWTHTKTQTSSQENSSFSSAIWLWWWPCVVNIV